MKQMRDKFAEMNRKLTEIVGHKPSPTEVAGVYNSKRYPDFNSDLDGIHSQNLSRKLVYLIGEKYLLQHDPNFMKLRGKERL